MRLLEIFTSGNDALEENQLLQYQGISPKVISAIIWIIASVFIVYALPLLLYSLVVVIFIGLALYELLILPQERETPIHIWTGMLYGISIPVITYLVAGRIIPFGSLTEFDGLIVSTSLLSLFIAQATRKDNDKALTIVGVTFLAVFYVSWLFSFLIKLKALPHGAHLVAFFLLVSKGSDSGAYLIGSKFGAHRLIPRISPNKSIEGFWGGLFVSFVAAYFCQFLLPQVPVWHLLLTGVVIGGISQFGDLAESIIKRDFQVKDSGSMIPGIGGILDLIDSLLLSAPLFYYWVLWFWKI